MPDNYPERAVQVLRQKGFRITQPRLAIAKLLASLDRFESAEGLHALVEEMDLVTVYRILDCFAECGLTAQCHSRQGVLLHAARHTEGPLFVLVDRRANEARLLTEELALLLMPAIEAASARVGEQGYSDVEACIVLYV